MPVQEPSERLNAALTALLGRPRTVLEVGCASGIHGMVAQRSGARVTGIEGDTELAARAGRALDEVLTLDPEDRVRVSSVLGQRKFDLVLVPDLLERARDPEGLLDFYAQFVADEGRLLVSLTNRDAWPVRLHADRPEAGYVTSTGSAPRLFSRDEALRVVEHSGLELLEVSLNPMLLRALRLLINDEFFLTLRHGEGASSGFRDLTAYEAYVATIRPFEVALARLMPRLLAFQHVLVARKKPKPGPLSLTIGMLTMDEEPSVARMIDEVRKHAPDAKILLVDSSLKDQTPVIAERMGARVLRQLPPRGHGPAMELLMYEAAQQSDALIYLDCDFTYPPPVIVDIKRILETGVDVVNAARVRTRPAAMPLPNYLANKTFVLLAQLLNGMPVADLHSGMRGYRSSVIRAFSFDGEGDALPIDTVLWPARSGYHVVEVPIEYQERVGASKLRKVSGTVWTFIRLASTLRVGTRRSETYDSWETLDGGKS
ncbi:MAG TPA: methyltransferase domain-containing protein [Polyangiaceae bacterium]|jgi:SAM-dependent methyltransferase|nr:methyltransferase domain-containing protein [Polyangiaceae bacterium]